MLDKRYLKTKTSPLLNQKSHPHIHNWKYKTNIIQDSLFITKLPRKYDMNFFHQAVKPTPLSTPIRNIITILAMKITPTHNGAYAHNIISRRWRNIIEPHRQVTQSPQNQDLYANPPLQRHNYCCSAAKSW